MVRTEDVCVDFCFRNAIAQILAYNEVVDTPAHVLLTGLESV